MTGYTNIYYENGTLIMHELSVANSIISSLEKLKTENGFEILNRVKISVGRLSGVNAESLRFALESLRKDSLLAKAVLEIEEKDLRIKCNACGAETAVRQFDFKCNGCSASDYDIVSGDTLEISEIEVD
jgi:hydrogenase nickel incorporation protein HypA/HybF